jgi:hypothetical protein
MLVGYSVVLLSWPQHNESSSTEGPNSEDCLYMLSHENGNSIHSTHNMGFIFKTKKVDEDVTLFELKWLVKKTPRILQYCQYVVFILLIRDRSLFVLKGVKLLCLPQHLSVFNLITCYWNILFSMGIGENCPCKELSLQKGKDFIFNVIYGHIISALIILLLSVQSFLCTNFCF